MDDNKFFSWDDELDEDYSEFKPLAPGTYSFVVKSVETGTQGGTGSMNGCPYADVKLMVNGTHEVNDRLFLAEKTKFKIAGFLTSIGMKKKGEPIEYKKILKSEDKTGYCTIECQLGKEDSYRAIVGKDFDQAVADGVTIFNRVKKYIPAKDNADDGGFKFD